MSGRAAVFFDRDGVLNRAVVRGGKPYPPKSLEELEILPGVQQGCEALRDAGFFLVVVTNQPDIARGTQSSNEVSRINEHLKAALCLDDVRVCPHDDSDACSCRKPLPGLLLQAAAEHGIDLTASYLVGDRWRDIEAGRAAGCRTVLVDYAYAEQQATATHACSSSAEAMGWILASSTRSRNES